MPKKKEKKMIKMIVLSDIHAGHIFGLTPQRVLGDADVIPRAMTRWYLDKAKAIRAKGPVDIVVNNGDAIEGPGKKQTIAHRTTDIEEQINWAAEMIEVWGAKKVYLTRGTPYHVTSCFEAENILAEKLDAEIRNALKLNICGKVFEFRHHTSKTSIPHGQGTLIAKRMLWTLLKRALDGIQAADVVIRSHVHELCIVDTPMGLAMTTPALQIGDEVYGRSFESWYHVGFLEFTITPEGIDYEKHILKIAAEAQEDIIYDA